jgi:phenylpropionate dioxygenase-like ring-hydroxylating dioxygenase large terminal subunit
MRHEGGEMAHLPEIIPNQWYVIALSSAVGRKRPTPITRLGRKLVLFRDASGEAHVADAACPHRGADLGLGRVVEGELECPYHGFRFGKDGACTLMPCEGKGARPSNRLRLVLSPLREAHGFLWLWSGPDAPRGEPSWIEGAPEPSGSAATHEIIWDVRYSRVMEGMLDLHHFPFAHRRYSPKGFTRLDPFDVTIDGNAISVTGTLRRDEDPPKKGFTIRYQTVFPGLLNFEFMENLHALVAVTPVNDERTWITARYAQSWVRAPLLDWFLSWLAIQAEFGLIQPDDHLMLRSTEPRSGGLDSSVLVRADRAVVAWHRLREAACYQQAAPLASGLPPS